MAFSIDDLKKNFPRIGKFESGEAKPTFGQMERLAEKYEVPQWGFVENELPDPYRLESKPALKSLFREKLSTTTAREKSSQGSSGAGNWRWN